MDIKEKFDNSVEYVKTASGDFQPSNQLKLKFYSLFKQATCGDANGKRPGRLNIFARAKFDAWALQKGMSQDKAMQEYVSLLETLKHEHANG